MGKEQKMRQYLERINPVLERLVVDLLVDMPEDFVSFSIKWFQDKGDQIKKQSESSHVSHHKNKSTSSGNKHTPIVQYEKPQLDSEEDEEDDDEVDQYIEAARNKQVSKVSRSSVSAEVYGAFNKKESFVPKVVPKGEDQKKRIETRLMQAFMFSSLDERERDIVVMAMTEGEQGNNFYMIEEGRLKATKSNQQGNEQTVFDYQEGDYFGELALVKNIPRQANVIAVTDARLVYLDHDTFKRLMGPIEGILQRNESRYEKYREENIENLKQ